MADLQLSQLSDGEKDLVNFLLGKARKEEPKLTLLERYRDAEQRVKHLGLAVPPELRDFETIINVPGMAVNEPVARQELRAFVRSGEELPDDGLREAWEYNNLASQSITTHTHCRTFGRAFVTVSTNPVDGEPALVTTESPLGLAVNIDRLQNRISAALRQYRDDDARRTQRATLYTQMSTLHLTRGRNGWTVDDRDDHGLGVVPMVMFLNRPWARPFEGRTEMADVIGLTDSIARMITNMQVAGETLALPHRWAAGIAEEDFVDEDGKPIPQWEAYMTAIRATSNADAKFGAFPTADLENFNSAVNNMLSWCGMMLGLPTRYMGQNTVNPAAEGAIVADEIRLIRNVERMNRVDGDSWAWAMALQEWISTGTEPKRNSIRAIWHNPATPTYSQRADAIVKLNSGARPLLSRQGSWDELGWSEDRKRREMQYLAEEANEDPLAQIATDLMGARNVPAAG